MFIQVGAATYVNLDNVVSIYPDRSVDGIRYQIFFNPTGSWQQQAT